MSLRSGFIARGFLFLGPDVASFGYGDGTDIPYVPGGAVITGPTIRGATPAAATAERHPPRVLAVRERKKGS